MTEDQYDAFERFLQVKFARYDERYDPVSSEQAAEDRAELEEMGVREASDEEMGWLKALAALCQVEEDVEDLRKELMSIRPGLQRGDPK